MLAGVKDHQRVGANPLFLAAAIGEDSLSFQYNHIERGVGNIVFHNALTRSQTKAQDSAVFVDKKRFCNRFSFLKLKLIQQLRGSHWCHSPVQKFSLPIDVLYPAINANIPIRCRTL